MPIETRGVAGGVNTSGVEAIITAELVDGQSIDNAIDSLILTHKNIATAHHTATVAGDLNHNDLANIDVGDINHLTDAQVAALHAEAHTHDTDTLQLDGVNSDGGAFSFTTSGAVTFNQALTTQGLLTADGVVPEGDLVDSLGTAALTWLDLFVQDIKDAAGNIILSNDGAGNIDALATLSTNIVFSGAETVDGVDISALSITNMPTAVNNWKMYCTNGAGVMTEIATGGAGTSLQGNGVGAAPSFQAGGGGGESLAATLAIGDETDGANIIIDSSGDLIVYSDDKVTEKARIDGATGNITTAGTVDGVDIATRDHAKYTDAEAHAYIEANALTITGGIQMNGVNITMVGAETVDGVDVSAVSITNMPTAVNNWKMYTTNGAGVMTELAVGASGTFLTGNGVGAAPSFQAQPAPIAHVHDGDTLQLDGINSNGGAFSFTTSGAITFSQNLAFTGAQTVDGKDVSTLGTDAEAQTYIQNNGLVLAASQSISIEDEPADSTYTGTTMSIDTTGCATYDAVYIDGANSVQPADADAIGTMPIIGVVVAAGKVLTHGVVRSDASWAIAAGATVYGSTTAGELSSTAPVGSGDVVQVVGIATNTDTIFVNPSLDWVVIA